MRCRARAPGAPAPRGRRRSARDRAGVRRLSNEGVRTSRRAASLCTIADAAPARASEPRRKIRQSPRAQQRSLAMAVHLDPPDPASLRAVAGVSLGTAMAGVRKANRRDVLVVRIEPGATVAGV